MKVSFPHIGREYAVIFKNMLEEMGMEVVVTNVNLGDYEHRTQLAELVSKLLLPKV